MQCTCAPISNLESCLKIEPKFGDISPLKISSNVCTNCCRTLEECKCRKTAVCCLSHEKCICRWCAMRSNCPRMTDKRRCEPQVRCINCGRLKDQCCCATFALIKCHKIKEGCNRKTMICLYCDNPQDKCTCRVIGKCCGLPSDVCNCQDVDSHARDRERIVRRPDETRTIRVTRPKGEIRQYFARNYEDFRPYSAKKCHCYEKLKRQQSKLPCQRLNIFSEVMNELQRKMSEPSVCCARCWRNPCCCGSPQDQDKRKKGERKIEGRVRCTEIEKLPRNKFPNDCRYKNEHKNIVQRSIPIGCVCKLSSYRCRKDRSSCKKPLAKCYYCKNLPCTEITEAVVQVR
ncbi:uncharacterized protein LOC105434228 isoform X1 [Pogonomyrmex barbatus]|uniref:Uncharacterized protein LOC105434228 isoform X1 n=1 Tax=Pogonomyrmex barbatus TaxID=144034 RepID=A0A6I9X5X3_9HYME|nr:uncharacterized protein LOC105434228 isoform X1 [Pogonomyrmex barbatus]